MMNYNDRQESKIQIIKSTFNSGCFVDFINTAVTKRADKRWTQVLSATLYLRKNLLPPPQKDYFCVWGALTYLQSWYIEWMTDLHTYWNIWGDFIYIPGGELDLFCEELRVPTSQQYSAIYRASESFNWIFNIMPSYRRTGRLDLGWNI